MKIDEQSHAVGRVARRTLCIAVLTGASLVLSLPVNAGTDGDNAAHSHAQTSQMPMDMHHSMMGMQQQMDAVKPSGDVDYDFAVMMRIHHQGAVDMAQMELDKGKDPQMQAMAKEIIAAQKDEIAQFDQWIAEYEKSKK